MDWIVDYLVDEEVGEQSHSEGSVFQWESVASGTLRGLYWEQCYLISSVMTQAKRLSAPTANLQMTPSLVVG